MKKGIKSIVLRIPGGKIFNQYFCTRKLKNTEWDFLFRLSSVKYWQGTAKEKALFKKEIEKYLEGDLYNFEIIKLSKNALQGDFAYSVLQDLIFPYLAGTPELSGEGTYEEFGIKVEEGDIVIDAGANIGVFTAFAAKHRNGIVHSFEPVRRTAELLEETVKVNEIDRKVKVNRIALGNQKCETEIFIKGDELGSSTMLSELKEEGDLVEHIKVTTLDNYVEEKGLDRVDFIKADIEGNERYMLEGAKETLRRFKPKLAICTYHLPDDIQVLTRIIMDANPEYHIEYGAEKLYAR